MSTNDEASSTAARWDAGVASKWISTFLDDYELPSCQRTLTAAERVMASEVLTDFLLDDRWWHAHAEEDAVRAHLRCLGALLQPNERPKADASTNAADAALRAVSRRLTRQEAVVGMLREQLMLTSEQLRRLGEGRSGPAASG